MPFTENIRRHMYIKTSPMQDLPVILMYGHRENVKAFMVIVPPTKVLLESFFCTHAS
jgi:hypothetical protein